MQKGLTKWRSKEVLKESSCCSILMWRRGGGRLSVANNFCSIFLLLYIFIAFKTRGLSKTNTSSARPRLKRKMMRRTKIVHIPRINDCASSPGAGVEAGSVAAKQVNKCNSQFRQFSWAIQTNWVKRCPPASAIRKQTKNPTTFRTNHWGGNSESDWYSSLSLSSWLLLMMCSLYVRKQWKDQKIKSNWFLSGELWSHKLGHKNYNGV